MKILLTGSTGFIGQALLSALTAQDHEITVLVRKKLTTLEQKIHQIEWPHDHEIERLSELLSEVKPEAMIHLAGAPIADGRWTQQKEKLIYTSRIDVTKNLVEAFKNLSEQQRPKIWINASAIGIYSDRKDSVLTEDSSPGSDFLAQLVCDWEREALQAKNLGARVILLRTGIVLGPRGGALTKMQPVILGSGTQWMSWIHLDDVIRFIVEALSNQMIEGPYNLTSPNPIKNIDFTKALALAKGFPWIGLKIPACLLKLALGKTSSLLLQSQRVLPSKALSAGFKFNYENLSSALSSII